MEIWDWKEGEGRRPACHAAPSVVSWVAHNPFDDKKLEGLVAACWVEICGISSVALERRYPLSKGLPLSSLANIMTHLTFH